MLEIAEDRERILDELVRFPALNVGDEADAAGILIERGIVKAMRPRQPRRRGVPRRTACRRPTPWSARVARLPAAPISSSRFTPPATPLTRLLLGASFASAAPIGVTVSRAPLVIGGLFAIALG